MHVQGNVRFWYLKLYCDYKYTRSFMINRVWGLKQLWLQVNGHAWCHLLGLRGPERKGEKRKIQNENTCMYPPGIEPATICILAGHLNRLAIKPVDYLCFKLVQYSEMTCYACGVSKHVAIQYIKLIMVILCIATEFQTKPAFLSQM